MKLFHQSFSSNLSLPLLPADHLLKFFTIEKKQWEKN